MTEQAQSLEAAIQEKKSQISQKLAEIYDLQDEVNGLENKLSEKNLFTGGRNA